MTLIWPCVTRNVVVRVSIVALALTACAGPADNTSALTEEELREHPQCLDTGDFSPNRLLEDRARLAEARFDAVDAVFDATVSRNNEAHDCQNIIRTRSLLPDKYGGILTVWRLKSNVSKQEYREGVVIAGLVNHGKRIKAIKAPKGNSCLVVKGNPGSTKWRAWIVEDTPSHPCAVADTTKATQLKVTRVPQDYSPMPYPLAVRIVDTPNGYYLGLQCLNAWCLIGKRKNPANAGPTHGLGDQQRLSFKKKANGPLFPSKLRGTIVPVATSGTDFSNFVPVAQLTFSGGTKKQREVYMERYGITTHAEFKRVVYVELKEVKPQLPDTVSKWYFRYNGKEQSIKEIEVAPVKNALHGSARWRWYEKDEGVWVPCPAGCCGGW